MTLRLYLDVHVRRHITVALRSRGVDVLTAQEDEAATLPDPELLDRVSGLGRVLFCLDQDLLAEAVTRQRNGVPFAGLIFAEQTGPTIGQCVRDLELMAKVLDPVDIADRVEFLPLK